MIGYGDSPLEVLARNAMVQGLVYLDQFYYSAKWLAGTPTEVGALGDKTITIQINSDSDFIAQEYHFSCQFAQSDQCVYVPPMILTITRSGSGRNLMNDGQIVTNVAGNYMGYSMSVGTSGMANTPGRLSITSLYQGNGTVSLRLQNPFNINPYKCEWNMVGFKVFYQTNAQGQTGNRQDIFHAL